MRKTGHGAIEIWREGSNNRDYEAVKRFGNAANRRKYIIDYED